jgi:hypothetical protein
MSLDTMRRIFIGRNHAAGVAFLPTGVQSAHWSGASCRGQLDTQINVFADADSLVRYRLSLCNQSERFIGVEMKSRGGWLRNLTLLERCDSLRNIVW